MVHQSESCRTGTANCLDSQIGERDPEVLASLAKGRLKAKAPELVEALNGRFRDHHAKMTRMYLDEIDTFTRIIDGLTRNIEEAVEPFRLTREILTTIPGVSELVADVIIAETGADMSAFTTPAHLASWAGVCPGSNESAGRVKSARTRPGNHYLKAALGTAALADTHSKNTYLAAKYRQIPPNHRQKRPDESPRCTGAFDSDSSLEHAHQR